MNKVKRLLLLLPVIGISTMSYSQSLDDSGISAGFFDSSEESTLNFSTFHLPPLSVLFENAKQNPQILSMEKSEQLAKAEVAKQKRHIFSYIHAHASYSYGKTDVYGQMTNNQTGTMNFVPIFESKNGTEQSYWNVGVNLNIPLEDILDWAPSVKRKRLEAEKARLEKDIKFEDLKLQISTLYAKITNSLVTLKTASEGAAAYQGAGALNQEDFHQGNMSIEDYAWYGVNLSNPTDPDHYRYSYIRDYITNPDHNKRYH